MLSNRLLLTAALATGMTAIASGETFQVIYTEIVGSPTAVVPGALDAGGAPAVANFIALEDINIAHDGSAWMLKGRTDQGSTVDSILILGSGTSGTAFAQDGQPFLGAAPGEQYDFFDTLNPVSWDETGRFAFSARAKNGVSGTLEKLILFDGTTHTLILQQGDAALGLSDIPTNVTGDEAIGNSIGSVYLRNDGTIGFVNTPIENCSSFRYPAYFLNNTGFRQSGVDMIAGEVWDSFSLSGAGGTPDGAHWFAIGDTEGPTATDEILVVDDVVFVREGSPVGSSTMIADDTFYCRMEANGTWFARGDDPNADDWAMINGQLIVKTGDALNGTENYGNAFSAFGGNIHGDWVLVANTDNPNTSMDQVLVYNGVEVCREGDPVDVDGNGAFDDNAFIRSFQVDDLRLTADGVLFMLITLSDGAGNSIGDAFVRAELCGGVASYGAGCAGSGGFVPSLDLTGCPRSGGNVTLTVANALGGTTGLLFFGLGQVSIPVQGCTLLVQPLPNVIALPMLGSGAGNGGISLSTQIPAVSSNATFDMQLFVIDGGVPRGFSNTNGLEVTINS